MNPLLDLDAHPVIAHRGASAYAPENTLPAFALALEQGADAIELDIQLTQDGVPVVLHDATVNRTTDWAGPVGAWTLAQLHDPDYGPDAGYRVSPDGGATFPFRGTGIQIPSLAQVLETFPDTPLLIEVKQAPAQWPVRRVLEAYGALDRCVVASAHHYTLSAFRGAGFHLGAARWEVMRLHARAALRLQLQGWERVRHHVLSVPFDYHGIEVPTRRFVSIARDLGCPVHVWTVDDPRLAKALWRRGVSGIVTNAPDIIADARDEAGLTPADGDPADTPTDGTPDPFPYDSERTSGERAGS